MHDTKSKWFLPFAMFCVAAFFYLYEFLLRVVPSVMRPELSSAFDIGAHEYGILAAIYFASYAPLQLPVGGWIDRYGPRRLLTFAVVLCALSTVLSAYTTDYYIALLARFLIGAGSAFGFISCMKVVAIWFQPQWFPVFAGATLAIGASGAAASAPISYALNVIDWRTLLIILGLIGLGIGLLCWLIIRDENPHNKEALHPDNQADNFWTCLATVVKQPQSWLVGIYAFLTTAPTDALGGAWGVAFLTDAHGLDKDQASIAQAMTFVGMAVGSPLLGWIAKRFNNRKKPMMVSALVATLALTALIYAPMMTFQLASLLFFMFGAFGTYVLAFVVIRYIIEVRYVATAVGFVNMISMIGSMSLTYIIGCILDAVRSGAVDAEGMPVYLWSDYKVGLVLLPIFYAVASLVVVPLIHDKSEGSMDV